jgi:aspartate aminotransferase
MLSKIAVQTKAALLNNARSASFGTWSCLTAPPVDPILGLNEGFKADKDPRKVLLGMGAYRDDNGKPYTLKCIREAEKRIFENNMDHEYAGIQGIDSYIDKSMQLAYGADSSHYKNGHIAAVQSISGTGSIRVGMEFLRNFYPIKDAEVYTPDPTWPIHRTI